MTMKFLMCCCCCGFFSPKCSTHMRGFAGGFRATFGGRHLVIPVVSQVSRSVTNGETCISPLVNLCLAEVWPPITLLSLASVYFISNVSRQLMATTSATIVVTDTSANTAWSTLIEKSAVDS